MTLPSYPSELPAPLRQGYQVARGDGRNQARQDAGPPNVRRRFSAVGNSVQFATLLDRQQLGVFETFYEVDTRQGSLPFLLPDPGTDGWPLLDDEGTPLLTDDDVPILVAATWVCLFGRLPVTEAADMVWRVTFEVVVMP